MPIYGIEIYCFSLSNTNNHSQNHAFRHSYNTHKWNVRFFDTFNQNAKFSNLLMLPKTLNPKFKNNVTSVFVFKVKMKETNIQFTSHYTRLEYIGNEHHLHANVFLWEQLFNTQTNDRGVMQKISFIHK